MTKIQTFFTKFIKYIKSKPIFSFSNIFILFIAFAVFYSPFVVDYATLPKGFELPKVSFWQIISIISIVLSMSYALYTIFKEEKLRIPKDFYFLIITIFLFFISTSLSPYPQMSLFGNEFRHQGFITHVLIITLAYSVYKFINNRNWHFIALAFITSSFIQAIIGFNQFFPLAQRNPNAVLEGLWINGTFGQANWYAGRLLIAVIFAAFYLTNFKLLKSKYRNIALNLIIRTIVIVPILIILTAMGFSFSGWAIISVGVAIAIIVIYELINPKIFSYLLRALVILGIFAGLGFLGIISGIVPTNLSIEYNFRIDIWNNIINIMFRQKFSAEYLIRFFFGYGFDTLGEVFRTFGRLANSYVDRAHNFFFDVLVQTGMNGLILLGFLFLKINQGLKSKIVNRKFVFTSIALLIWLFRSMVHESGIINIMDFLVILAICLGLQSYDGS
jgi:O-antigen ligase